MDAVIAIETDLNAIVKEVFILTAVSKWFCCNVNIAKLVVSVLSAVVKHGAYYVIFGIKNIQYLDYIGYRKTSSTFEEELLTLWKQLSKNITPPRSNSNITEIQVLVVSMYQLAIHCSYEKLSTPLCILVDTHELNIV